MSTPFVVAVDGPSGSGKSSTARGAASRLGLAYLDTGAMYRAVTWALLQRGTDLDDPAAIARDAQDVSIVSGTDPLAPTIEADGTDVAAALWPSGARPRGASLFDTSPSEWSMPKTRRGCSPLPSSRLGPFHSRSKRQRPDRSKTWSE